MLIGMLIAEVLKRLLFGLFLSIPVLRAKVLEG